MFKHVKGVGYPTKNLRVIEIRNCPCIVFVCTVHTSFVSDFEFASNITILMGDSGTGKTASFSFIKECMALNPEILCLNYLDYQKDIALDDKNKHLIIGRNPKNLFATKENLFDFL